jgi:transposase
VVRHAEEVSGSVAASCRYYGISRTVFYRWKKRYENGGLDGLKDRSSAPMHCPNVTSPEVVAKIVHLRRHYHFGPLKIAMYLQRYHDVQITHSGVWRVLKRLDMNRLPASQRYKRHPQRWKRYEKQRPGHQLQIDVKFIEPIAAGAGRRKRYYQYTAIDDCTRLRVLRIYPRSDQKTAIQFFDYVASRLPFTSSKPRPTMAQSSSPASTGTCSTAASVTATSDRRRHGSTGRWRDLTASMRRSSTACSTAPSSTTPACSTTSCASGRTTTTTTDPWRPWRPDALRETATEDSPARHRPTSAPHLGDDTDRVLPGQSHKQRPAIGFGCGTLHARRRAPSKKGARPCQ